MRKHRHSELQRVMDVQQLIQCELRDINLKLDYLIEIFRDEFGPIKPHR